jgi:hypothetical protein
MSTIGLFAMLFQLMIAFFDSIGLFGVTGVLHDTSNANVTTLLSGIGVGSGASCGGIPFSCTTVGIAGGALLSSILFFGAWAFATGLWVGFYGACIFEIAYTCSKVLYLPTGAVAIISLAVGAVFFTDLIMLMSWRDVQAN